MGLTKEGRPILNLGYHSMGWDCGPSKRERDVVVGQFIESPVHVPRRFQ